MPPTYKGTTAAGCNLPARVFVNNTEIPVINEGIKVEQRKEGSGDIHKRGEVYYPREWGGANIEEEVFGETPGPRDQVKIEIKGDEGNWIVVHCGYLHKIGEGGNSPIEKRFIVGDYSELLSHGAGKTFHDTDLQTIVEWVRDELIQLSPILDKLPIHARTDLDVNTVEETEPIDGIVPTLDQINPLNLMRETLNTPISFSRSDHSLSDVLDWSTSKVGARWFMEYDPEVDGPVLVIDDEITRGSFHGHHIDGEADSRPIHIRKNNALQSISPVNTVEVIGVSSRSKGTFGGFAWTGQEEDSYPVARVFHKSLVERAGGQMLSTRISTDAVSVGEASEDAKTELKSRLDDTGRGQIVSSVNPHLHPYGIINAKPVCSNLVEYSPPATEYEIESVVHEISVEKRETTLSVSLPVTKDDIFIDTDHTGLVQE